MRPADVQQLIDHLWDFDDAAGSGERFRNAIHDIDDPGARLELLTQIARAQGLRRKFDEAHRTLDEVERADAEAGETKFNEHELSIVTLRVQLERGRLFNSSDQRAMALPLFKQAFEAATQVGNDHLAIDAAHMIAIVHDAEGQSAEAMLWNQHALQIAESSQQERARQWRGSLHNNMGWTLHSSGDFKAALIHFERALQCRREERNQRDVRIATWCVARCLRSLNRLHESLAIQQSIAEEIRAAGEFSDGFNEEELGECLLALNRGAEAAPHFRRAFELLSQDAHLVAQEPARVARLKQLCDAPNS